MLINVKYQHWTALPSWLYFCNGLVTEWNWSCSRRAAENFLTPGVDNINSQLICFNWYSAKRRNSVDGIQGTMLGTKISDTCKTISLRQKNVNPLERYKSLLNQSWVQSINLPSRDWTTPVEDSPWVIKKRTGLLAFKPSSICFKENGVPGGFTIFWTTAPFLTYKNKMWWWYG